MKKGLDPNSLGLIKYDTSNTDPKYTLVEVGNGLNTYAIHPKHFNETTANELHLKYPQFTKIETDVYCKQVQVKGQVTHSYYNDVSSHELPVVAKNNVVNGKDPFMYGQELIAGTQDEYAPFLLQYGVDFADHLYNTEGVVEYDVFELFEIDEDADSMISVQHPGGTIAVPLPWLKNQIELGVMDSKVRVTKTVPLLNGFIYDINFAGTTHTARYQMDLRKSLVLDNQQQYMAQNKNREQAFETSTIYSSAISLLQSASDFSLLGGASTALDAFFKFGLRDALATDRSKIKDNIGGDVFGDPIDGPVDYFLTIGYPVPKVAYNYTSINQYGGVLLKDFAPNELKTYDVHSVFENFNHCHDTITNGFKGELVTGDIEPVVNYGEYTKYFKQILERGGLLEVQP